MYADEHIESAETRLAMHLAFAREAPIPTDPVQIAIAEALIAIAQIMWTERR